MPYYPEDQSELRNLYWGQGLSIAQIAKMKHLDTSTIYKRMVRNGVPRRSLSESISKSKRGELNPRWGGNNVNTNSGRDRAQRMYPPRPCRICGGVAERHHKDDDTLNNEPSNIDFLCRKHHMEADGRMDRRKNGQFVGAGYAVL